MKPLSQGQAGEESMVALIGISDNDPCSGQAVFWSEVMNGGEKHIKVSKSSYNINQMLPQ